MEFYLNKLKSDEDLKELFIEKWNWESPRISELFFNFTSEENEKIEESSILAEKLGYKILFFKLKNIPEPFKKLKTIERRIMTSESVRKHIENAIFIFSFDNFNCLDFVKTEKSGPNIKIKRFSISPENRDKLRTPSEQLESLNLSSIELSSSLTKDRIDQAFSVDLVTKKFYQDYIKVFYKIRDLLDKQKIQKTEEKDKKLRDFIHQILNRLMFLYFVQRRKLFGGDKSFLVNFWDTYKNKNMGKNQFHQKWLDVLFFEALAKPRRLYRDQKYLNHFNKILKEVPYLNGGLFEKTELDEIGWQIPDELFDDIFEFFESYNFTVEESTRLDIEIAIDPEMLGNIYEHLVNVEEQQEQAKAGIFYTQETEIELMFNRSLVEFLFNKTKILKNKIYQLIFKEEDNEIKCPFNNTEAEKILNGLEDILILDPACGSGHYLVVANRILYELKEILWQKLNKPHLNKYEEKKKIIERNIYGNDIKKWAIEIAKLRLWLDLFVDADIERLNNQYEPLLPNLGFKIRSGDSLVQRIGKSLAPLRRIQSLMGNRRNDLKNIIQKKKDVYNSGNAEDYKRTLGLEKNLLLNVINEEMLLEMYKKIQNINAQIHSARYTLFGKTEEKQKNLFEKQLEREKEALKNEYKLILDDKIQIQKEKEAPMIWDLAFAEVFAMKKGFDIVIANPPYVRQEQIEDLSGFYQRKEYKDKLLEQLQKDYSYDFQGVLKEKGEKLINLGKRSDLYVYFYLKGLKLLNENGIFCYISSNSWLDVGYGAEMQEILLKRVPIMAIYDNQVKRSFAHADINTIIAIKKSPKLKDWEEEVQNNQVSFVTFKKPFDEILYSDIFIDLEQDKDLKELPEGKRRENEIYRLHKVKQSDLYEFGKDKESQTYTGNKWGGKYLRAPDIYWTILEKGGLSRSVDYERERESKTRSARDNRRDSSRLYDRGKRILLSGRYHEQPKLVRLGDIADVRFGIKTGANEFFYLEDVTDRVEEG